MKISELLSKVGDEHIKVQQLMSDMTAGNIGKRGATITFATDSGFVSEYNKCLALGGSTSHVGLVVWIPADRLQEARK